MVSEREADDIIYANNASYGLNPCFNGIWSLSDVNICRNTLKNELGLNPCFNGIWSLRGLQKMLLIYFSLAVLILVLMEYGL